MFQQSAMLHLGKMSNPSTGKTERNLVQAKMSVDILEMLSKKTKGNLDKDEEKFLANVLADAQLNYASEASKPGDPPESKKAPDVKSEAEEDGKAPAEDTGGDAPGQK